ncbi:MULTISPECIES: BMC domain-containing protein [Lactobacillaceae]|uniref:BMC domain-containing protein n=1 Tax=Lactobacillaceae TaxID=33958 RepID=UPI000C1B65B2|nr:MULTISPECIES: BMC domain-containing protein [Lactobacillaceae]
MTEKLKRVIQESVPGKQITLAHVISKPDSEVLKTIGIDDDNISIGIMTITPPEAAAIASDIATKSGLVKIVFIDRFSGSVVLSGDISSIKESMKQGMYFLRDNLGFSVSKITMS